MRKRKITEDLIYKFTVNLNECFNSPLIQITSFYLKCYTKNPSWYWRIERRWRQIQSYPPKGWGGKQFWHRFWLDSREKYKTKHNEKGQTQASQQGCGIHGLGDIKSLIIQGQPDLNYSSFGWWIGQDDPLHFFLIIEIILWIYLNSGHCNSI